MAMKQRYIQEDGVFRKAYTMGENLRAGMAEHGRRSTFLFMNREIVAELNASDTLESRFIREYGAAVL